MTDDAEDGRRASDVPLDLVKEREVFVRSFLKRGVELTEELIHENQGLRDEIDELRDENARLRAQLMSDDAMRDFMRRVDALEREKRELLANTWELERVKHTEASRFESVERELNDLANLYIAAFQLHASLSARRVVRHLLDMLGQLVGAYSFAIYVIDRDDKRAYPIASEKLDASSLAPVPTGEGLIGEACLTGLARIPDDLRPGTVREPLVVIPLLVADRPVGAISIVSMLPQKTSWASVDTELFKLLGTHAGVALIAANLYAGTDGPLAALADLRTTLEKRTSSMVPGGE